MTSDGMLDTAEVTWARSLDMPGVRRWPSSMHLSFSCGSALSSSGLLWLSADMLWARVPLPRVVAETRRALVAWIGGGKQTGHDHRTTATRSAWAKQIQLAFNASYSAFAASPTLRTKFVREGTLEGDPINNDAECYRATPRWWHHLGGCPVNVTAYGPSQAGARCKTSPSGGDKSAFVILFYGYL